MLMKLSGGFREAYLDKPYAPYVETVLREILPLANEAYTQGFEDGRKGAAK